MHMTTYYTLNKLLFYIEFMGFCFESVPAGIQKLWPSSRIVHEERKMVGSDIHYYYY